ncbi:MAG: nuclear transport factor 2 family protein [Gemmatimonadales bacterium]
MLTRTGLALAAVVVLSGGWLVAPKNPTLSAQDMSEIQSLYTRYNWSLDTGDAEAWAATFTPDGVFTIVDQGAAGINAGREALLKFATGFHATLGARVKHWNTNLMITPVSGGATGRVYLVLVDFGTKPASLLASSTYSDELVKTKSGWRFTKRAVKGDVVPAKP